MFSNKIGERRLIIHRKFPVYWAQASFEDKDRWSFDGCKVMQNLASSLVLNLCVKEWSATSFLINEEAENLAKEFSLSYTS